MQTTPDIRNLPVRGITTIAAAAALAWILALALPSLAQAAPANPGEVTITQPDGTTFKARAWGDESRHGIETTLGYTVIQDEASGYWVYAVEQDGALAPAMVDGRPLPAGQTPPTSLETNARPEAPDSGPGVEEAAMLSLSSPLNDGIQRTQNNGTQRLVMVMVDFNNQGFSTSAAAVAARAFGATNSIQHYYKQASYNNLVIAPVAETQGTPNDGVVYVHLNMSYPLTDDAHFDDASQTIAKGAIAGLKDYIDFAALDTDADGYITSKELHIIIVVAGYESSYCGSDCPDHNIWGHRWELYYPDWVTNDGKIVGTNSIDGDDGGYAMFGELHGYKTAGTPHLPTIGIMVHELGHDLSWPDLYDVDYSSAGVGEWSIMSGGSWNGLTYDGDSPALPDAFLRWYQGWLTPVIPTSGTVYNLSAISTSPTVLLISRAPQTKVAWQFGGTSGTTEYWLVENRQKVGYDAALPGCGVLIWHIDETRSTNNNYANSDEDRPLVALEQADGRNDLWLSSYSRGDTGDPYPGANNNLKWGPATTPNSRYYNNTSSRRSITFSSTGYNAYTCPNTSISFTYRQSVLSQKLYVPSLAK